MRKNQTALSGQDSTAARDLYVAFELSKSKWKLAFSDEPGRRPRLVTIDARDLARLEVEINKARTRFGLESTPTVHSCYEAGRDGFWIHRALTARGIDNIIVDPASIEVNRRKKRAKTDRIDATKLVGQLLRYHHGEKRVWSVVRVPSVADEDDRQLHRELDHLKNERAQHRMRIQSLLFTHGVDLFVGRNFLDELDRARQWDGKELPPGLKARLIREHTRLNEVLRQIRKLKSLRKQLLKERKPVRTISSTSPRKDRKLEQVAMLTDLRGLGIESSWLFVMEFFGWREFQNRREVGGAAGLTPTPYNSGDSEREQGISKAGHKRVRCMAVEIAWCWLRYQPESKLSSWFNEKFASGGSRMRRVGIVALARRLLVALWRYVTHGVVPEGALMKTA